MTILPFDKTVRDKKSLEEKRAQQMPAPMIQAKNLWKTYGDNVVLERLNISVKAGEFITMVGTSG